jgi:hypothetical protein
VPRDQRDNSSDGREARRRGVYTKYLTLPGQVVIEVKTNQLNSTPHKPKGRYDSAIKPALALDLYMLTRINAKTKLLVLTDRPLFDLCSRDMDGLLAPDTRIVHCSAE